MVLFFTACLQRMLSERVRVHFEMKLLELRELKPHDEALPTTEHDDGLGRVRSEKMKYAVSCPMLSHVLKGRILWE